MANGNDRISSLETLIESRREDRDRQVGDLSVDIASNKEGLAAVAHRLQALESVKQPTVLSYWGPAIATLAMVGAVGGAFLTMLQREQSAREEVINARYRSNVDKIIELRVDVRDMDSRLTSQGEKLSAVESRQEMDREFRNPR